MGDCLAEISTTWQRWNNSHGGSTNVNKKQVCLDVVLKGLRIEMHGENY